MQAEIDDGIRWCETCDKPGWHTFCGHCGKRHLGADRAWQECRKCKAAVATEWCPVCGARMKTDIQRKIETGEITTEGLAAAAARADEAYRQAPGAAPADGMSPVARAALEVFGGKR